MDRDHTGARTTYPGTTVHLHVGPVDFYLIVQEDAHKCPIGISVYGKPPKQDPAPETRPDIAAALVSVAVWAREASEAMSRGDHLGPFERARGTVCEPRGPCPEIEGVASSLFDSVSRWMIKRYEK